MSAPLKIAVAGVGRMGAIHAMNACELARESHSCELGALVDADIERLHRFCDATGIEVPMFESVEELANSGAASATVVVTPTELHREHAAALIRAGHRVLLEKPLTGQNRTFNMRDYGVPVPEFAQRFGPAYKAELATFIECYRNDAPFPVTHRDGVPTDLNRHCRDRRERSEVNENACRCSDQYPIGQGSTRCGFGRVVASHARQRTRGRCRKDQFRAAPRVGSSRIQYRTQQKRQSRQLPRPSEAIHRLRLYRWLRSGRVIRQRLRLPRISPKV